MPTWPSRRGENTSESDNDDNGAKAKLGRRGSGDELLDIEVPVTTEAQQPEADDDADSPDEEGVLGRRGPSRVVHRPTAVEMSEHSRTHIPYRVWCPY